VIYVQSRGVWGDLEKEELGYDLGQKVFWLI